MNIRTIGTYGPGKAVLVDETYGDEHDFEMLDGVFSEDGLFTLTQHSSLIPVGPGDRLCVLEDLDAEVHVCRLVDLYDLSPSSIWNFRWKRVSDAIIEATRDEWYAAGIVTSRQGRAWRASFETPEQIPLLTEHPAVQLHGMVRDFGAKMTWDQLWDEA